MIRSKLTNPPPPLNPNIQPPGSITHHLQTFTNPCTAQPARQTPIRPHSRHRNYTVLLLERKKK